MQRLAFALIQEVRTKLLVSGLVRFVGLHRSQDVELSPLQGRKVLDCFGEEKARERVGIGKAGLEHTSSVILANEVVKACEYRGDREELAKNAASRNFQWVQS
jgi:hypothetical protein